MSRLLLFIAFLSCALAQNKPAAQSVAVQIPDTVGVSAKNPVTLQLPQQVQVSIKEPVSVDGEKGFWPWFKGEPGAGWASFAAALATLILLVRQNSKQDAQNRQQDTMDKWQVTQAEITLFNDVLKRIDEAEARWSGVKSISGIDGEKFTSACVNMLRVADYWCYLRDEGVVKDASIRAYLDHRIPQWKADYLNNENLKGLPPLPYLDKVVIAALPNQV